MNSPTVQPDVPRGLEGRNHQLVDDANRIPTRSRSACKKSSPVISCAPLRVADIRFLPQFDTYPHRYPILFR